MASATNDALRTLAEGHRLMSEQLRHMSTTLDHLRVLLEVKARERQAAVCLQAAARGLLARRLLQTLRGEKSSEEQAAVRLQAAGRGFLVRRAVRKMHMLLSSSLQCAISHSSSPIRPAAPIEIEVRVWGLPARRPTSATQHAPTVVAASVVLAPALVLDRSSARTSCYILHPSSNKNPAVWLFPWDPGHCRLLPRPVTIQLEGELGLRGRGRCHGQPADCHRDGRRSQPKGPCRTVPREQYPSN